MTKQENNDAINNQDKILPLKFKGVGDGITENNGEVILGITINGTGIDLTMTKDEAKTIANKLNKTSR